MHYAQRCPAERLFSRLKQFWRVTTRYAKLDCHFLANAPLAAAGATTLPGLVVYPNPAQNRTSVHLPASVASPVTLTLRDALGRVTTTRIVAVPASGLVYALGIGGLPTRMYVLQVRAGMTTASHRLVEN